MGYVLGRVALSFFFFFFFPFSQLVWCLTSCPCWFVIHSVDEQK